MKSHEALKAAIDPRGPKLVAAELGVSLSLVYKWMEDGEQSGARNPLDRVASIVIATGDLTPVEWLCRSAGGVFVKNPEVARSDMNVLADTQRLLREFSDVLDAVTRAFADGRLTAREAAAIRREWDELKSVGETLVVSCEKHALG